MTPTEPSAGADSKRIPGVWAFVLLLLGLCLWIGLALVFATLGGWGGVAGIAALQVAAVGLIVRYP